MRKSRSITISLPQELSVAMENAAMKAGVTRSEFMRIILYWYLEGRDLNVSGEMLKHLDGFLKRYGPVLKRLAKQ